jgi:hypothetical protein
MSIHPIILLWPVMPKSQNFNRSLLLILYSSTLDLKCMKWINFSTLWCGCYTIINFFCSAQLWAKSIGRPCSIEDARTLYQKYLCKNHFLASDFTTPERRRLNRGAVPCSSGSAAQDPPPQLPDSALTDLNSLPSLLSSQENLHVQPPSRTYGKLPVSSSYSHTVCGNIKGLGIIQESNGADFPLGNNGLSVTHTYWYTAW